MQLDGLMEEDDDTNERHVTMGDNIGNRDMPPTPKQKKKKRVQFLVIQLK